MALLNNETMPGILVSTEIRQSVEEFVFAECEMLDNHDYYRWGGLWADNCRYWIPSRPDEIADSLERVSLVFDDRPLLEARIQRLEGNGAYAHKPSSTLARVVGNLVVRTAPRDSGVSATCTFVLLESRREEQFTWGGKLEYLLLDTDDGWKMAQKKVLLTNCDQALTTMSFLP